MSSLDGGGDVLSDVEIILPSEVVESLVGLSPESLSCFMSVDEQEKTTKQLFVHKLSDRSVRIRVTVTVLGSSNQKLTNDKEIKDANVQKPQSQQVDTAAVRTGIVPENGHERMSLKRKPKPYSGSPVIANKLNKSLASIWQSKRKKVYKNIHLHRSKFSMLQRNPRAKAIKSMNRHGTAVVTGDQNPTGTGSNVGYNADESKSLMNPDGATVVIDAKSVGERADENSQMPTNYEELQGFDLLPGSSTVIILKTVISPPRPTKTPARNESPQSTSVRSDRQLSHNEPRFSTPRNNLEEKTSPEKPKITSRDIAERLKARERKTVTQVSCELCGEVAESYANLYHHIKKQHDDCTFVRNYLEEIEPLASTPCPVCKKPFTTAAGLTAHISSVHPENKKPSKPQLSKLSAQRHHFAAEKKRAKTPSEDSSDEEDENDGPFTCKVCGKEVEDIAKYRRHVLTHGEFRFPCSDCGKRFRMKENLMKHIRRIHGKSTEKLDHGATVRPDAAISKSKTSSVVTKSGFFRCDRCKSTFNRTSLLVTHMRYCLKQNK